MIKLRDLISEARTPQVGDWVEHEVAGFGRIIRIEGPRAVVRWNTMELPMTKANLSKFKYLRSAKEVDNKPIWEL